MAKEISALENEIEETRDRLATTIDELVYRANPKTILGREAAIVKGYFVDESSGEPRTANILKVVGVVAGVAVTFVLLRRLSK